MEYNELIDLGFKREDSNDEIWKKQHGYDFFFLTKKLGRGVELFWEPDSKEVEAYKTNSEGSIVGERFKLTRQEVIMFIDLFGEKKH